MVSDASAPAGTSASPVSATGTPSPERSSPTPAAPSAPPAVVVLDPGHNGGNASAPEVINRPVPAGGFTKPCNTTGTSTDAGYAEHEFTFDVAQRAAALLRQQGMTVLLTRTEDSGVGPCVDERAAFANHTAADVVVSIHADGAAAGVEGFHVIEPALAPDGGNAAILDASHKVATELGTAFAAATQQTLATYPGALEEPGLTRRDDLAGLNLARVPAVFIECANMRNADDAAAVSDPAWRQSAAQGIAQGVVAYLVAR
ncbi:N-acetylmuramoyl-L-alanine amidase [Geodermatophilus aquaeductus]|nr:N-acetylmuramoyl-L-alanine amidase [Geodermatophilus aquaeductus]